MTESGYRQWVARAAFAATAALAGGNAGAVVYSSTFDPPNFSGTATFDVTQGCLDAGPGFVSNNVGDCVVTWLTATVTFQDAPGHTFDYSHVLADSTIVTSIWVQGGELAGIVSGALGPRVISGHSNPAFNGPWWIQYQFSPPSDLITALDGPPSSGSFGLGVVYLYGGTCTEPPEPICTRNENEFSTADVENFNRVTQVPEPGSLALILAALAGVWCARRRTNA